MTAAWHGDRMDTTTPTRITIELEPAAERRGGWRARTRVQGEAPFGETSFRRDRRAVRPIVVSHEAPDVTPTPAAYEPSDCTCEDGLCARDHENE